MGTMRALLRTMRATRLVPSAVFTLLFLLGCSSQPTPAAAPASGGSAEPAALVTDAAPAPESTTTGSDAGGGAGKTCTKTADCGAGEVCEGEMGCDKTWTCKPERPCTRDLRSYCGCDGKTFSASGACPGAKYSKKGGC